MLRFGMEPRNMCWGDVKLKAKIKMLWNYLEFSDRQTKTHTGENPRDLRMFKPKEFQDLENPTRRPVDPSCKKGQKQCKFSET